VHVAHRIGVRKNLPPGVLPRHLSAHPLAPRLALEMSMVLTAFILDRFDKGSPLARLCDNDVMAVRVGALPAAGSRAR
jgi:hypothetical protein